MRSKSTYINLDDFQNFWKMDRCKYQMEYVLDLTWLNCIWHALGHNTVSAETIKPYLGVKWFGYVPQLITDVWSI